MEVIFFYVSSISKVTIYKTLFYCYRSNFNSVSADEALLAALLMWILLTIGHPGLEDCTLGV